VDTFSQAWTDGAAIANLPTDESVNKIRVYNYNGHELG